MDTAPYIFDILYTFSSALLYPVVITLIILAVYSLMLIGEFISELARRKRDREDLELRCRSTREHLTDKENDRAARSLRLLKQNFLVRALPWRLQNM